MADAMRELGYDSIEKPFPHECLAELAQSATGKRALRIEAERARHSLQSTSKIESFLIGHSVAVQVLRRKILNLADTSADVLIIGETGTGKELVARCLHDHSRRRARNFVAINCGGLPETLLESELFGHEAGAFTTAAKRRIGKIEHAEGGTLLLDEIESMPLSFQVKLLRILQERTLQRLGSNDEIELDVRVVAATKCDLREISNRGRFRSDLYYRLNVAVLKLPPLRERREDIPLLFEHFLVQAAVRYGREATALSGHEMRNLMAYDWPGNVRELRNVADRFVLGLFDGNDNILPPAPLTLAQQLDVVEKVLIEQALTQYAGSPQTASDALGIAKKTLYDKMHRHGILIDTFRAPRRVPGNSEQHCDA